MNSASKSPPQLCLIRLQRDHCAVEAGERRKDQIIALSELKIQKLEEALRLERIKEVRSAQRKT